MEGDKVEVAGKTLSENVMAELDASQDVPIANLAGPCELLLLQGKPIGEPVVQHGRPKERLPIPAHLTLPLLIVGPFVMTTKQEIMQAFQDYQRTEFGSKWPVDDDAPVHPREQGRFARYADGSLDTP